jgi:hypothetical protein
VSDGRFVLFSIVKLCSAVFVVYAGPLLVFAALVNLPQPRARHKAPLREASCRVPHCVGVAGIPPDVLLAAQDRLPASSDVLHNGSVVAHLGVRSSTGSGKSRKHLFSQTY